MNQLSKLNKLVNLSYFDKNTLSQFVDIKDNSLYANIKRWIKRDQLIQLKKGLYVTNLFYRSLLNPDAYAEFLANKLKEPSYISLEYVLQKYNILTESVFAITSITLKTKRTYKNKLGIFIYRNIKEALFTGYTIKTYDDFEIKEATKAKALFDYLYLKFQGIRIMDLSIIDSLRLNLDEISDKEIKEFSQYCKASNINKFTLLPELIEATRDRKRT